MEYQYCADAAWDNLRDVTVKDYNGNVTRHYDIVDAVRAVGSYSISRLRGSWLRQPAATYIWLAYQGDSHAFYTAEDIRIPVWKVKEVAQQVEDNPYVPSWRRRRNFKFRDGPVEGIHCHRASRYRGYRKFSTHQERKETAFHEKYDEDCIEYHVKIRGRRKHKSIPTRWDDIRNHSYYKKTWKDYRDHQWK